MTIDRSTIRMKAMLIAPHPDGIRHLVSRNAPSIENPEGFDRLIGGTVEFGETHRQTIIREIDEELGAEIIDLEFLGVWRTSSYSTENPDTRSSRCTADGWSLRRMTMAEPSQSPTGRRCLCSGAHMMTRL